MHEIHVRHATASARHAPDLPFGAVIVDSHTQTVIAKGSNRSSANHTWHGDGVLQAECHALCHAAGA